MHTGDVGSVDEDGYFTITDRMKDIIITAGGKNVTPSELENDLKFSPYITDAVVIGDKRPYLTAIIMIDQDNVEKYAQDNDVPFSNYASLTRSLEVQALIQGVIDRRQQEVRPRRADQEILPARHAAQCRGRGTHPDHEAQTQAGREEIRRAD
jgi:long-subunit acyl-CoA synthetase (AMP-forming)